MNDRDSNELIIHVMHGYDSLQAPNGEKCFGCYIKGEYEIYIADNIPTDQLFHTIAHEYMHYLQDIEGREPNEKEADDFGFSLFTPCYQQGIKDSIDVVKKYYDLVSKDYNRDFGYSALNDLVCKLEKLIKQ